MGFLSRIKELIQLNLDQQHAHKNIILIEIYFCKVCVGVNFGKTTNQETWQTCQIFSEIGPFCSRLRATMRLIYSSLWNVPFFRKFHLVFLNTEFSFVVSYSYLYLIKHTLHHSVKKQEQKKSHFLVWNYLKKSLDARFY